MAIRKNNIDSTANNEKKLKFGLRNAKFMTLQEGSMVDEALKTEALQKEINLDDDKAMTKCMKGVQINRRIS